MTAPLAGVRVLDLTRLLPGPMATLYLADLGADVVKIEDTAAGDYARTLDPSGPQPSACFRALNRGKRSVSLDLRHPDGRAAFFALVRTAHVVIEGFRPGVVAALGVDHAAVAAVNPAIVYCSLTGYGQDGPRAAAAGHDINYLGYAGVLEQTGSAGGAPVLGNVQIADLLGGAATAAIAILAALLPARTRGEGRYLDVAMADGALAHNVFALHALEQHGATAPRGEDLLTGGVPCYGVYATRDGRFLAVGALERKFWQALCDAGGRAGAAPRRAPGPGRRATGARRGRRERARGARGGAGRRDAGRVGRAPRRHRLLRDAGARSRRRARRSAVRGARHGASSRRRSPGGRAARACRGSRLRRRTPGTRAGRAHRRAAARGRLRRRDARTLAGGRRGQDGGPAPRRRRGRASAGVTAAQRAGLRDAAGASRVAPCGSAATRAYSPWSRRSVPDR